MALRGRAILAQGESRDIVKPISVSYEARVRQMSKIVSQVGRVGEASTMDVIRTTS
jgi:hypothetical protein